MDLENIMLIGISQLEKGLMDMDNRVVMGGGAGDGNKRTKW